MGVRGRSGLGWGRVHVAGPLIVRHAIRESRWRRRRQFVVIEGMVSSLLRVSLYIPQRVMSGRCSSPARANEGSGEYCSSHAPCCRLVPRWWDHSSLTLAVRVVPVKAAEGCV